MTFTRRELLWTLTLTTLLGRPALADTFAHEAEPTLDDVQAVARGQQAFACELYKALARGEGDRAVSPFSVSTALSMTWAGARGETGREMQRVLGITLPPGRHHEAAGALVARLAGGGQLVVANRLFGEQTAGFRPAFLAACAEGYGAGLEPVDFRGAPERARLAINAWAAERTKDLIRDLLPAGAVSSDTRLVLANAVHFQGAWAAAFDPEATRPGAFTLATGERVEAPLMRRTGEYRLGAHEGARVLELPYAGGRLAMTIVVPERHDGLAALEETLSPARLAAWQACLSSTRASVALPRFEASGRADLREALEALGMRLAFDVRFADLSGISTQALAISRVEHQAVVKVAEEGTEAAAATAVVVDAPEAAAQPFVVDRPFLFVIHEPVTGAVLFMGRVTDPR